MLKLISVIFLTLAVSCGHNISTLDDSSLPSQTPTEVIYKWVMADGSYYIADSSDCAIRKVVSGTITTVAGTPLSCGFSGDGAAATAAQVDTPSSVFADTSANLFIVDHNNNRIRKVTSGGTISTIAGTGTAGFTGDGGPATAAEIKKPVGIVVDHLGNIYFSDTANSVIRKIDTSGVITTIAGTSGTTGYTGDNGLATAATFDYPAGLALDPYGNLYVADQTNQAIRKISATTGIITTVAGGSYGFSGDNGPATSAQLKYPYDVAFDSSGNFYIADYNNDLIRKVNTSGVITTVVGIPNVSGDTGDGGPALSAKLWDPTALTVDSLGNVFIADTNNNLIRFYDITTLNISTVAGVVGAALYNGDNRAATTANLLGPFFDAQ